MAVKCEHQCPAFHRHLDHTFLGAMLRRLTSPGGALHRVVAAADPPVDPGQIQSDLPTDPGWIRVDLKADPGQTQGPVPSGGAVPGGGLLSPQAISNILWALATLNYPSASPSASNGSCADPSVSDGSHAEPPGVALAVSSHQSGATASGSAAATSSAISLLAAEAAQKLPFFRPQELANVMWALAVLQQQGTHVRSFVEAASTQLSHLNPEGRRQVFSFMLAAEDAGAVGAELRDSVPLYREVREACREAWLAGQQALPSSSGV